MLKLIIICVEIVPTHGGCETTLLSRGGRGDNPFLAGLSQCCHLPHLSLGESDETA